VTCGGGSTTEFPKARASIGVVSNQTHQEILIMARFTAVCVPLAAVVVALVSVADSRIVHAEESPMQAWMEYLEGKWTYEISDGTTGTGAWTFEAGGQALVGRFQEGETKAVEIGGWQPDAGIGVVNGYNSRGEHWQLEYHRFSDNGNIGTIRGKVNDTDYSGELAATIWNDDRWSWTIIGTTSAGEPVNVSAMYTRERLDLSQRDEEADKWHKFFLGEWKRERELWMGDDRVTDTATWSCELAADGKATVSKGKWDESGIEWVMISGSGPETFYFERGTDSSGLNWSIDYSEIDGRTIQGKSSGVAEGQSFRGTVTITMTGEDSYMATLQVKLANGEVRKARAINTRVKAAR
jgi:hypothetical protein